MRTEQTQTGTVAASGIGRLTWRPSRGQTWIVDQMSLRALTVGGSAICQLERNGNFVAVAVATADVISGDPPLQVRTGDRMDLIWSSAVVGSRIEATAFYDDGN